MAEETSTPENTDDPGSTEEDAKRLLEDTADDDRDPEGADSLGDPGKRALDKMKEERRQAREAARQASKRINELQDEIKNFKDSNLSESQRLQQDRDDYKSRAERAESSQQNWDLAIQVAEELELDVSVKQLKAVARRISGDSDETRTADAKELFNLIATKPAAPKVTSRPKEKLRGGSDPDEGPEELNPVKLAAQIPRAR